MTSKILRADGTTYLSAIKSVVYHESVNADIDLRPGCVASSYIEVTCFGAQTDAPDVGEALTYYQVVGETETLIGIFYAEPSIPTKNSYSFIAYDAVHKLDADVSAWLSAHQEDFPYTVKQLVEQACTIAGITLGTSSWDHSTMSVNAWYADGLTCRNILQYAAEIGCKFVRCHSNGQIYFDWYSTVSNQRIYPSSGTSGSETRYAYKQDGLTYDNYDTSAVARVAVHPVGEDDVAYYYPTNVQSGNTLNITNNALLYGASAEDMAAIAQSIYTTMTAFGTYRPMSVEMFPNECPFKSGDIVPVTDAQGVSFTTAIMEKTVTDSAVTLTSTGREVYGDYALDTAKQLVQLASDIVRINKLKVDWAEIGTAVIGVLNDEGITAAKLNGANQEEQLVYISKASGTTTQSKPSSWVTNTTGNQNTWTLKRPVYNSSYPVLFVATQRKAVDGTVTCTTPAIDQTTTVIDGGHITTGTIDASVVNVTNIDASNINTGALTVRDANNNIIFQADQDLKTVQIGGFEVGDGELFSNGVGSIPAFGISNEGITFNWGEDFEQSVKGDTSGNLILVLSSGLEYGVSYDRNVIVRFYDNQGIVHNYPIAHFSDTDGVQFIFTGGETKVEKFTQVGANSTVSIANPSAWRTAIGAVNKAGDTMTGSLALQNGSLVVKNTTMDTTAASQSTQQYDSIYHYDKNNRYAAYWQTSQTVAGTIITALAARKYINGANVDNYFRLAIANNGTATVGLSHPAAWRAALGLDIIPFKISTTVLSGSYIRYPVGSATDDRITENHIAIINPYYSTGFMNNYFFTCQVANGYANIYVRNSSGAKVAAGTTMNLAGIFVKT